MSCCQPSCCGPSCVVPSCSSTPCIGIGAQRCGTSTSSCCLGTVPGVVPSCITQLPASEMVIQPPAVVMTIPGPIMSASCEPIAVGGTTPCAVAGGCSGIRGIGCSPCWRLPKAAHLSFLSLLQLQLDRILRIKMSYCQSVCDVPCGVNYGYGGVGSCGLVPVYGGGALSGGWGAGGALSGGWGAGGALSGVGGGLGYGPVACASQLAGSEVVIQPPASVVSIPGPILSSTGEPALVSGYSACAGYGYPALGSGGGFSGGSSSGGYGRLGYGGRYGSGYCGGYGSGYGGYGRVRRYSQKRCGPC
ncbi:shematrin-like protein 2 [Anolis carolinensis]